MIASLLVGAINLGLSPTQPVKLDEVAVFKFKGSPFEYFDNRDGQLLTSVVINEPGRDCTEKLFRIDPVAKSCELVESFDGFKQILSFDEEGKPRFWDSESSQGHLEGVRNGVTGFSFADTTLYSPLESSSRDRWALTVPHRVDDFAFAPKFKQLATVRKNDSEQGMGWIVEIYDCNTPTPLLIQTQKFGEKDCDKVAGFDFVGKSEILIGAFNAYYKLGHQERVGDGTLSVLNMETGRAQVVLTHKDVRSFASLATFADLEHVVVAFGGEFSLRLYEINR